MPHGQRTPPKPLRAPAILDQRAVFALVGAVVGAPIALLAPMPGILFCVVAVALAVVARRAIAGSDGRLSGAPLALVAAAVAVLGILGGILAAILR